MLCRFFAPIRFRLMSTKVQSHLEKISQDFSHQLNPVAKSIIKLQEDMVELDEMKKEKELFEVAEKEASVLKKQIDVLQNEFLAKLAETQKPDAMFQNSEEIMLEISAGVGGQEAMLFAKELHEMYFNFANFKRWGCQLLEYDPSEIGGLRHSSLLITNPSAYKTLSLESGVHRVQRVPKTEKAGRIHTSTCSVSITPALKDAAVKIDEKDLKIERKKASGAGGQHVNTTESAVRMTHIPSGLVVDVQMERSQIQNRSLALKMLENKLYKLKIEEQLKTSQDMKKKQVGMRERSDKIRTYNYPQDRITDHRFGTSFFNIRGILSGEELFENFLEEIKTKESDFLINLLLES